MTNSIDLLMAMHDLAAADFATELLDLRGEQITNRTLITVTR